MEFKKKILENDLAIVGEVNGLAKSAAVGFFIKTGSRDESDEINGMSHFLEHMLFKGTENLDAFEVSEAFDRRGAQFNAFTSEENTVFYAAVLPEFLIDITKLWIEMMRPSLRDDDFNIEKNVIKEEIAMYKDIPSFDVMDICRSLHFDGHSCGNSVLGSTESIDNLKAEQMRSYFTSRYSPNNITVAVAGNFNWDEFCSIVEDSCGQWDKQAVTRKMEDYQGSKKKDRTEKANLACEHICLMSPAVSAQDTTRFTAALLANIVGDSVGSRFFWELVDKALAESAIMQFGAMDGTGVFCSYFCCSRDNVTTVLDIVVGIFQNLSESGVTEGELKKAKNKILSALVIKNELPMGRLVDLGLNWTYLKKHRAIEEDIKAVNAVTIQDIRLLIDRLNPGDFTQFSIGPK